MDRNSASGGNCRWCRWMDWGGMRPSGSGIPCCVRQPIRKREREKAAASCSLWASRNLFSKSITTSWETATANRIDWLKQKKTVLRALWPSSWAVVWSQVSKFLLIYVVQIKQVKQTQLSQPLLGGLSAFPPSWFVGYNTVFDKAIGEGELAGRGIEDNALKRSQTLIAHCYEGVQDSHGSCGMLFFITLRVPDFTWPGAVTGGAIRPGKWVTDDAAGDVLGDFLMPSYLADSLKLFFVGGWSLILQSGGAKQMRSMWELFQSCTNQYFFFEWKE